MKLAVHDIARILYEIRRVHEEHTGEEGIALPTWDEVGEVAQEEMKALVLSLLDSAPAPTTVLEHVFHAVVKVLR